MTTSQGFNRLTVSGWRQFGSVDIKLDRRLTVLTGANAAGKTTLLNILGIHMSRPATFIATPKKSRGQAEFYSATEDEATPSGIYPGWFDVGQITYRDNTATMLTAPPNSAVQYNLVLPTPQNFQGIFLQSHRNIGTYTPLPSIPPAFSTSETILMQYVQEIYQRSAGGYSGRSAQLQMKEALLAAALYRRSDDGLRGNDEAEAVWSGFQLVLKTLFPTSLGFQRLEAQPPEVVAVTESGDFLIDAMSGGLSAIVEVAWQVYLRSLGTQQFIVCIDEPENHLHPSLQRQILPNLLSAFPDVTFIVATHSPFVVTSSPDSRVYVLDYDDDRRVISRELDFVSKSESAEQILERVLGVSSTLPIWAENRYNEIIAQYSEYSPTIDTLRSLKNALTNAGLAEQLPLAVEWLVERNQSE